ncbi:hypothetical protein ACROYT_G015482 [Oculina patagonica]
MTCLVLPPHSCYEEKEYCSCYVRKTQAGITPYLTSCECSGKCREMNFPFGSTRSFKLKEMENLKKVELHHFSDTSTEGYGQCLHLPLVDTRNQGNCLLVMVFEVAQGQSFLWDHHDSWKNLDKSEPEFLQRNDKEVRKASSFTTCMAKKEQNGNLPQWLEYFSSWFRAKCLVAVCLRYQKILLERTHGKHVIMDGVRTREYHPADVAELTEAEKEIIRHVQREAFKGETRKLKKITKDNKTHREDDSKP